MTLLAFTQKMIAAALIVASSAAIGLGVIIGAHLAVVASLAALQVFQH